MLLTGLFRRLLWVVFAFVDSELSLWLYAATFSSVFSPQERCSCEEMLLTVLFRRLLWVVFAFVDSELSLWLYAATFSSVFSPQERCELEEGAF